MDSSDALQPDDRASEFAQPLAVWASEEEQQWALFRQQRLESLNVPFGWVSLHSYEWLPSAFAPLTSIPGLWQAGEDGLARLAPEEGSPVLLRHPETGEPLDAAAFRLDEDASETVAVFDAAARPFPSTDRAGNPVTIDSGEVRIELGRRGGRYMIRTHGEAVETARITAYPFDAAWKVPAVFEPYAHPQTEGVLSAREDTALTRTLVGTVALKVPGSSQEIVLGAEDAGPGEADGNGNVTAHRLNLVFADQTSGTETPAWRFVTFTVFGTPEPGPEIDGNPVWKLGRYNAVIDFNRTLDYPMALSPYAVCAAPVLGNAIPAPVTSGEKAL